MIRRAAAADDSGWDFGEEAKEDKKSAEVYLTLPPRPVLANITSGLAEIGKTNQRWQQREQRRQR